MLAELRILISFTCKKKIVLPDNTSPYLWPYTRQAVLMNASRACPTRSPYGAQDRASMIADDPCTLMQMLNRTIPEPSMTAMLCTQHVLEHAIVNRQMHLQAICYVR